MRALLLGVLAVSWLSAGCENVHVIQAHDVPTPDATGEYVAVGSNGDQEHLLSVCPDGYYTDAEEDVYAGTNVETLVLPRFRRHRVGFETFSWETPRIEHRKSFHCAPPYVPAGVEDKMHGVAPGAFGAPVAQ